MHVLNLGILAHVDAGKTTLTERLLHAAGVIDSVGSVDDGSTQTDFLPLERQRGITIKSAVVSFRIDDVTVNLIDTPGHPDFIAEVERILHVLDGAILVVSAVEGVQAQTRVLMRTLKRLGIPTIVFVNKIDRTGAREQAVLHEIAARLTPAVVPLGGTTRLGTREADFVPFDPSAPGQTDSAPFVRAIEALAEVDEDMLEAVVERGASRAAPLLAGTLRARARDGTICPLLFGSAMTGAGVDAVKAAVATYLPTHVPDREAPASGTVFKVERGTAGEKVAFVRMFTGTLRTRDVVALPRGSREKVTAVAVFEDGAVVRRAAVEAGRIGKVWGLTGARIGDAIGAASRTGGGPQFAPPTLETAVVATRPEEKGELHTALTQLAEQDPLINLRQDDLRQELFVSLYGEVQKEVIEATLELDYGLQVRFRETSPVCIERPVRSCEAVELMRRHGNPLIATVGMRVDPAPPGSGVEFRLDVKPATIPVYVYKSVELFHAAVAGYVNASLEQGLCGWHVTDCVVTMTHSDYLAPGTGARDVRYLVPLVLMTALDRGGTQVCEPIHRFRLEAPADSLGTVLRALARLDAVTDTPATRAALCVVEGRLPAARMHDLQIGLRGLTRGEGTVEFEFDGYEPVRGAPPVRPRTGPNPIDRREYLRMVLKKL